MKIEKNSFVELTYELRTDNSGGDIVEKADENTPLKFVFGAGRMLEMFENKIEGMEAGQEFNIELKPEDAYGELDPAAIVDIPKNVFVVDGALREDLLQVGAHVPMMGQGGQRLIGIVLEVTDDKVKMDFNHPLSGETLYFTGKILNVREATAEELVSLYSGGCGGSCGSCGGSCGGNCDDESTGCTCGNCR